MKTRLILLLLFIGQIMSADCDSGFIFYPQSNEVHRNTKIVIESYGWTNYYEILKKLDVQYPIFLKSKNRKIQLTKEHLLEGQYGLSQAMFCLEEPLVAGETYEIQVEGLNDEESKYFNEEKRRTEKGKYERIKWVAKDKLDNQPPQILRPIKPSEVELIYYGCGPEIYSKFEFKTKDESELFILTEVVEIESNNTLKYYVYAHENELLVGHGMCAGAFNFKEEKSYKVRFKFYDINGNTDDEWTDWMKCENPWSKD